MKKRKDMTKFKTVEEWKGFCNNNMFCICGKLMTGLHMRNCRRVREQDKRFGTIDGGCPND